MLIILTTAGGALIGNLILYRLGHVWYGYWVFAAIGACTTIIGLGSAIIWRAYHVPIERLAELDNHAAPAVRNWRTWLWKWLRMGSVIIVVSFLFKQYVLGVYRVETDAVSPEIPNGSRVFVYKLARTFEKGDIILYHRDGKDLVGRVVEPGPSVPGDNLVIERRDQAPQAVAMADVVGRVVFNTRSATRVMPPMPLPATHPTTGHGHASSAEAETGTTELAVHEDSDDKWRFDPPATDTKPVPNELKLLGPGGIDAVLDWARQRDLNAIGGAWMQFPAIFPVDAATASVDSQWRDAGPQRVQEAELFPNDADSARMIPVQAAV